MFKYINDGASYQSKAVLAYMEAYDGIECSWCKKQKRYKADPNISRWENCREQGYIVSMRSENHSKQINIAFFEHRNSDSICAIKWEQLSMNSINISNAKFGDVYKDKYDTSKDVSYGEVSEMASWIYDELSDFWIKNSTNEV